ncbi:MAG: FliM/FliN family flagellar motor switch protein [Succinivibrio sp.]
MPDPSAAPPSLDHSVDLSAAVDGVPVALRIGAADDGSFEGICRILSELPPGGGPSLGGLECELRLVCGKARLKEDEYRGLGEGDVLVASEDFISGRALQAELGSMGYLFKIGDGGTLVLESFFVAEDSDMAGEASGRGDDAAQGSVQDAAQGSGQNGALPDFEVRMELGSLVMAAADISALKPGSVISAGISADAPVRLRCGSKVFAKGRLVDLGGTLGVQIVSMGEG